MGNFDVNIVQLACFKIAAEQKIAWFKLEHAKVLLALCNSWEKDAEKIANAAGISMEEAFWAFDDLIRNKVLGYEGKEYSTVEILEAINMLIDLSEERKSINAKIQKEQRIEQAKQKELARAYA